MELVGFVKSLLRHRVLLGAILALAMFAAFLTAFKVGSGGVERRSTSVGAATSQILVDSAESTLVKGAASDQLAALGTRASVYAQYLSSREAVGKIARELKLNPLLITASGPFSEARAFATTANRARNRARPISSTRPRPTGSSSRPRRRPDHHRLRDAPPSKARWTSPQLFQSALGLHRRTQAPGAKEARPTHSPKPVVSSSTP